MKNAQGILGLALLCGCAGTQPMQAAPVVSTPQVSKAENDVLELRLDLQGEALASQGFAASAFRERGFLPVNGRVTHKVTIDAHTCAKFVSVATPSVIDLDAAIYRADGVALIEDDGSDARPELTLCAGDKTIHGYYTLHAYQGVGAFATAQFVRPAAEDDDLITRYVGESTALTELAALLSRRGFEDAAPRIELALSQGRPVRVAVPAKEGDCYTLAVERGVKSVQGLALRLLDSSDRELAHGLEDGGLAALQFCAERSEELALEVSVTVGEGKVRVARFRAEASRVGGTHALWLGEPSPSHEAWRGASKRSVADIRKELKARGVSSFVVEERPLHQGQITELESKAPLGRCEAWDVTLQPGLSRATVRIESLSGDVLGEAETAGMRARVSVCDRRGPARVSVVGRAGFGKVTIVGEGRDPLRVAAP